MSTKRKHLDWFTTADVYYNEKIIMQTGSTFYRLTVDVWSGNHPFYNNYHAPLPQEKNGDRLTPKPI